MKRKRLIVKRSTFWLGTFFMVIFSLLLTLLSGQAKAEDAPLFMEEWTQYNSTGYLIPYGLAIDSDGNIYLADQSKGRIVKLSPDGNPLLEIDDSVIPDHEFSQPFGIDVDSNGNIYLSDRSTHYIYKFAADGTFITMWGGQGTAPENLDEPHGVAVTKSGDVLVYVVDTANNRVVKFDSEGNYLDEWGEPGAGNGQFNIPIGIEIDDTGKVFVTDKLNHRIQVFDADGNYISEWGEFGSGDGQMDAPVDLSIDNDIYVIENNGARAQKFDSSFGFLSKWGQDSDPNYGNFKNPHSIIADPSGVIIGDKEFHYLYVSDTDNLRILKFRYSINEAPENTVPGPQTLDEDNSLTFSSGGGNEISTSDPDAGDELLKVTLTASHGTLTLSGTAGLDFSNGTGDGTDDQTMTFEGSQTDSTTALDGLLFTPEENYNGTATVEITTDDQGHTGTGGAKTDSDSVTITINPINDVPEITGFAINAYNNINYNFTQSEFTSNFNDVEDGNSISKVKIAAEPTHGELQLNGNPITALQEIDSSDLNNLVYAPETDYLGADSFTWNASDSEGAYAASDATVNIDVTERPNSPPTVSSINGNGNEDSAIIFEQTDFINAFTDPDSDSLEAVKIISLPNHGTLLMNGVPSVGQGDEIPAAQLDNLSYMPADNYFGPDSFTYNARDFALYADVDSTVNLAIAEINDPPTVSNISKPTLEDTSFNFIQTDFTNNFSDPAEGSSLAKVQITSLPAKGTLKLGSSNISGGQEIPAAQLGTLSYKPDENYSGDDTFGWNGSDGTDYAASGAHVNITITAVNNDPATVSDFNKSVSEDETINFNQNNFESKFSDPDGPLAKVKITSLPANGTLKLGSSNVSGGQEINAAQLGTLSYVPDENYFGSDTFGWNGSDGNDYAASSAQCNITITPINNDPAIVSDVSRSGTEDEEISFAQNDFASKFSDPDGPLAKVKITSMPTNGTLKLGSTDVTSGQEINAAQLGTLNYMPEENYFGPDSFDWNGSDGNSYAASDAHVNLTITSVNDIPTVTDFNKNGSEDEDINFVQNDFTSHFTDSDGSLTKVQIKSLPANGVLKLDSSNITSGQEIEAAQLGNLSYAPDENFNGSDSFNFNGSDGDDYAVADAEVTLTIDPVNDLPTVFDFSKDGQENQLLIFSMSDFTDHFSDAEDEQNINNVKIISLPSNGSLKLGESDVIQDQEIAVNDLNNLSYVPQFGFTGSDSFNWNGSDSEGKYATDSATVTINITALPVADLALVMEVNNLNPGVDEEVVFTLTATNNGPEQAAEVHVKYLFSSSLTYVSDDSGGTFDPSTGVWDIGTLDANDSLVLTITAQVNRNGAIFTFANILSSGAKDPDTTNNSSGLILNSGSQADLMLKKQADTTNADEGDEITFTVKVINKGLNDAAGITVTDILSDDVAYVNHNTSQGDYDPSTGTWNAGSLAVNETAVLDITVQALSSGEIINTAFIAQADQNDPDISNNSDTVVVNPTEEIVDLSVSLTANNSVVTVEDEVLFTVFVRNNGLHDAHNVQIGVPIPQGQSILEYSVSLGQFDDSNEIWSIGTIPAGGAEIMNILVGTSEVGAYENQALVINLDENDVNIANNSNIYELTVIEKVSADLVVTMSSSADEDTITGSPGEESIGENLAYTILVTNNGPDDALEVLLEDTLPDSVTFVSADPSQGFCTDEVVDGTVVCDLETIPNGAGATVELVVTPTEPIDITNTATVSSSVTDTDNLNNTISEETRVIITVFGKLKKGKIKIKIAKPEKNRMKAILYDCPDFNERVQDIQNQDVTTVVGPYRSVVKGNLFNPTPNGKKYKYVDTDDKTKNNIKLFLNKGRIKIVSKNYFDLQSVVNPVRVRFGIGRWYCAFEEQWIDKNSEKWSKFKFAE
jgi:uncharacterized repeat protein (TIGR01451 family)